MASPKTRLVTTGIKLAVVGAATAILSILIVNAMRNPIQVSTFEYTADFTDASGLRENSDVRYKGKRVGKVSKVDLKQVGRDEQPIAKVSFSLDKKHSLNENSVLSIKYLNLTGVRYLQVEGTTDRSSAGPQASHLSVDQTIASYDITELFNGLQPVLATMQTADINQFSENAIALLQGDGSGLGPMLNSTQKIMDYATDRQELISTLSTNLARISDVMGGRNENVVNFIEAVDLPITSATTVLDEFAVTASAGPALFEPVERLLAALEVSPDADVPDRTKAILANITTFFGVSDIFPDMLGEMRDTKGFMEPYPLCSEGTAQIPLSAQFFLNDRQVTLCRQ